MRLPILFLTAWLWGCSSLSSAVSVDSAVSDPTATNPSPSSASQVTVSDALSFAGQQLPVLAEVQLGTARIELEVTQTLQEQALGLMFRESLADNRGMLFEFNPPRPVSFWMKNVVIPLDMIFVRNGKIVAIAEAVPPCATEPCPTYGPPEAIDQVIELRGGRAAELDLKPGDAAIVEWLSSEDP